MAATNKEALAVVEARKKWHAAVHYADIMEELYGEDDARVREAVQERRRLHDRIDAEIANQPVRV